jgi:hypothetical protein
LPSLLSNSRKALLYFVIQATIRVRRAASTAELRETRNEKNVRRSFDHFSTREVRVMTTSAVAVASQWEYSYVTRKTEGPFLAELNALGCKGWELVSVLYDKDVKGIMCWNGFLKRPGSGQPAAASQSSVQTRRSPAVDSAPAGGGFDLSDEDFKLSEDQ